MARKQVKPDQVRVRVLGATELQIGSRRVGMNTEALFALALYLTTRAGERIGREEILEVFWTEGEEESRRHAMRQMMYRLRQKGLVLDEEGEFLRLDPGRVESDLRDCLQADWPERAGVAEVEAALALGPTFSSRLSAPFLDWFDGVRAEVAGQHRKAAAKQITLARREGRWEDVERWARAVLRSDPLNEEATLARAESAAMSGSKVQALEILDTYLSEIGQVAPELGKPAVVLRKRIAEKRADWRQRGPREVRLVGRATETAQLIACIESCVEGRGFSLQLSGASGFGKSRLLHEAREFALLRGITVVHISCEALMTEHPYSFARDLVAQLLEVPGAAGVPPLCMEILRQLVAEGRDSIHTPLLSRTHVIASDLTRSLIALLTAVAQEVRLIVSVDDLHYADHQSLSVIGAATAAMRNTRCSFLFGSRSTARPFSKSGDTNSEPPVVRISPLAGADSLDLAIATIAAHELRASKSSLEGVVREAGGNPLFVRELALARARAGNTDSIPDSLARIVLVRLGSLDELSLRTLRIIALLGDTATTSRVRRLSQGSSIDYARGLETLESDAIVALDDSGVLRVHDFWRNATVSGLPSATGAALALECAEFIMAEDEISSPHLLRRAAYLFRQAGDNSRALELHLTSVDSLQRAGLVEEALASLEALTPLARDKRDSARILARKSQALLTLGHPDQALVLADESRSGRWLQLDKFLSEHLLAVEVSAECLMKLDLAASAPMTELLALSRHPSLPGFLRQRACTLGARIASNTADTVMMRTLANVSSELCETGILTPHAWMTAILFQAELGSIAGTQVALAKLDSLDLDELSVADRCLVLRFATNALRVCGEHERAANTGIVAFQLSTDNNLAYQSRLTADLMAFICLDQSRLPEAEGWIDASQNLSKRVPYGISLSSLDHARDRLDSQLGNFEKVAARITTRLDGARKCSTVHGRAGELSLASYCLAQSNEPIFAAKLAEEAIGDLTRLKGRWPGDFPTEVTCKALMALGREEEAEALALDHVRFHRAREAAVLGTFFDCLRDAISKLPREDGGELARAPH